MRGALFCVLLLCPVAAQAHDWYTTLKSPAGEPCCDERDCQPVEYRQDGQHVEGEVLVGGNWLPVDWKHVVTVPSPDGRAHVCWWPDWVDGRPIPQIRCIILPG